MTNLRHEPYGGTSFPFSLASPELSYIQELLDFSSDVFCALDKEGRFVRVSTASKTVWGYEPGEVSGKLFLDLVADDSLMATRHMLNDVLSGAVVENFQAYSRCADGSLKPVLCSARWNASAGVICCVVKDGSETYKARQQAKEYEQRLYRAYKLAEIGWWEWSSGDTHLQVSEELLQIFGLPAASPSRLSVESYVAMVHPGDRQEVLGSLDSIWQTPRDQYVHRLVKPSGETIHVIHYVQIVKDADGKVVKVHGTTKDISRRKNYELALRQSQRRMEDIVESLGDGFFALDHQWHITYWNKKAEDITLRKRSDVVGRSFWELYPKAKALKFYTEFHRAVAEKQPVYFEEYSPSHRCWMDVSVYPSPEGLSVYIKDVTERKRYEEQHRQLDQKLQNARASLLRVLENMSDGFFTVDRSWTITFATDKVAAMLGVNKDSYVGRNLWEGFPEAIGTRFFTEYQRAFATNTLVSFEEFLPSYNIWFEVSAYPNQDELSIYLKDITARKQQEKELQISNERFQFVSMATSDVIWDWNLETGELYINQSFTKVFGYEVPDQGSVNHFWINFLYPDDKERVISSQLAAIHNRAVSLWEDSYRFVKQCGEIAYVTDRAVIIRNSEGKALRMIGAVKDVTERKRQEQRLEFIAKATSEVIWERGIHSSELEISGEKFKQLFGYDLGGNRMSRSFWMQNVHPDDLERVHENREYALQLGLDFYLNEYRFKRSDGSWAYVKDRTYILRGYTGEPVSLVGAMEDITSQRLSEKAIVESEKSYRQLFNNAPLPTMIFDTDTLRYLDVNRTAVQHYGYSREEFLQMTVLDMRPKEERQKTLELIEKLSAESPSKSPPVLHLKKTGERLLVEISVTRITYQGKNANLATVNDVTEKLRLQNELTREKVNNQKDITKAIIETQEKERSEIGTELHDNVNQMLTTAKLYVENIGYYPEQSALFAHKSVGILQGSINEIRRLSKALVTPTIRDVGFKDTLQELVASYQELRLFDVHTVFDFNEEYVHKGVKLTIYRILQEAFNNTVKYAQASLAQVVIRGTLNTLKLIYQDDGQGFDPATVKGGIGLQNIQNRADAYRGKVLITSSPGNGVELKIVFPLSETTQH